MPVLNENRLDISREILVILNSFLHDMSTGVWFGTLLVMKSILGFATRQDNPVVTDYSVHLLDFTWAASEVAFVIMLITGALRVFTLKYYGWSGDIAGHRKRLLIIKHVILGIIVGFGLYLQFRIYQVL